MYYEDLLSVPYIPNGRDVKKGLNCYGLVIEMCNRNRQQLKDIVCCDDDKVSSDKLDLFIAKINVKEIPESTIRGGDIVQCTFNNNLHIGYMINKDLVIHMTFQGVRITPIIALENKKIFRVI